MGYARIVKNSWYAYTSKNKYVRSLGKITKQQAQKELESFKNPFC